MVISLNFHLHFTFLRKTVGKNFWKFRLSSTLTSFLWQVFSVASNTITQRTRIKTTTRRQFRFFIMAHAYLTREKRVLACGLGCALLMQCEHSKRHMNRTWWVRPWATRRRSQSQGFASNLVQELREEDERSFHNFIRSLQDDILKITTRPLCARNFRIFFDKFSLSTRTDEQILQCDNFFLTKCTCSKAIMLAFEQVHLSRKKLTNSSLHTNK